MSDSDDSASVGSGAGSGSGGGEDAARTALLSLQLSSLRLAPDAPQVHEIEWHPTRPLLAAADVGGCVSFYRVRRPAPRAAAAPRRSAASAAAKKKAKEELPFGGHKLEAQLTHHSGSVRSIVFHPNGDFAYSGSADKSIGIIDMRSLTLSSQLHDAHDTGINKLCFYDENMLLSGDDDGFVHVWDLRADNMNAVAKLQAATGGRGGGASARPAKSQAPFGSTLYPLLRYEDAADYISDFLPVPSLNRLVVTSGDGHLYVYDVRAGHVHEQVARAHGSKQQKKAANLGKGKESKKERKLTPSGLLTSRGQATDTWWSMSDDVADELSGAALLKRGRKLVVAGREEGVLNIYKWDYFGSAEDHFHLSSEKNDLEGAGASIDCMLRIDEDTLLTGSTDGLIRLVALHPNRLLGIMGTHEEFPIESMRMSPDRKDYFDSALPPLTEAQSSDEEDDDEDEDAHDDDDDEKSSSGDGGKPRSERVKSSETEDAAAEAEESFSGSTSGLTLRFLASSSHDGLIKFWNCSELFEVDPDDPVAEDEDSSDDDGEAAAASGGKKAAAVRKKNGDDESEDDSDADEAAEKEAEKSIKRSLKRKQPPSAAAAAAGVNMGSDEEDKDDDDDEEDEEDAENEDEDAAMEMSDESDSEAGDEADGSSSAEDDEAAATRLIKAAAAKVKKASSGNIFARLAPSSSSSAAVAPPAAAAAAPAPAVSAAGVPNMWMLVAPPTAAPAAAASGAAASAAPKVPFTGSTKRSGGRDLNADTSFFANLPVSHPMHPSQAGKRAAKAPLQIEKDNIAHRGTKKRAELKEKLAKKHAKAARLAQRRADAVARGEDPEQQQLSTDEEDTRARDAPGAKKRRKLAQGGGDSDDGDSDDSDDSSSAGGKPQKMNAKERRAAKKAERNKNPFFDGM